MLWLIVLLAILLVIGLAVKILPLVAILLVIILVGVFLCRKSFKITFTDDDDDEDDDEPAINQRSLPKDGYYKGMQDKAFNSMEREYYSLLDEIEADYSVVTKMEAPDSAAYDKLEKKCLQGTALFEMLVPMWKKYERGVPVSCPAFKRLAMLREKKGDYQGAALACVQQLRLGVTGDGTNGGMRGRLARMVKKGNLAETCPESMKEISTYLEIKT